MAPGSKLTVTASGAVSYLEAELLRLPLPPAMRPLHDPCAEQLQAARRGYTRQHADAAHRRGQGSAAPAAKKGAAGMAGASSAKHPHVSMVESTEQRERRVRGRQDMRTALQARQSALDDATRGWGAFTSGCSS